VEAEGRRLRKAGAFSLAVRSGTDWFDLEGQFDFEGVTAGLPELLAAVRRGDRLVRLGDSSHGMLPEEWLEKYAPLADLGRAVDGHLRFLPSQTMLLDVLLAAQPDVPVDETFERLRDRLRNFKGVAPVEAPAGFVGKLRAYQQDGLGWLAFLQEFSFGGCLADDMGLGKTIQVLALLEMRRTRALFEGEDRRPSLVVVPRSLVHNWIEEAGRFTPDLKVLDYTGLERTGHIGNFDRYDLVVTSYGTVRRDILQLKEIPFDYVILDEAQAIKNPKSQAARASRLLASRFRLALSGTPVENHLGELGSIFDFLNPGMLGRSGKLGLLSAGEPGKASLDVVAQGLRPFILRRTKEQVLSELPRKTEQTLFCEMESKQRRLYDELRAHYRGSLKNRIEKVGIKKAKIHVLEALLRLRQAACHPGLIDASRKGEPSAKLETLLDHLREVIDEGHKALVFSQFTSFLALVRDRLDHEKVVYEYLDGKTRDRQKRVARFQTDEECRIFLVSLKAGGQGLNLTAADYVFILDPWWNPAVEAQAVDRAHRIGQTRRVFAYRLIARNTVEEKILMLQAGKRKLAEAIITADESLIRTLTAEDLRVLLE
jgi:SNF2 family DNA or RNA helicase